MSYVKIVTEFDLSPFLLTWLDFKTSVKTLHFIEVSPLEE